MKRVGLISDTHGLLRPEAEAFLQGSDFIIHAGDIGDAYILRKLRGLAPLTAIRGNNDTADWADRIKETGVLKVEDVTIYILHNLAELDIDPAAKGFGVVVSGHSHRPSVEKKDGVLYVNPGSAGPRRFKLPIAVAELKIAGAAVQARVVDLPIASPAKPGQELRRSR
jgi:putative phosphoesterase